MRRRRTATAVILLGAMVALAACSRGSAPKATGPTELRSLAQKRGIAIGAEFVQVREDSSYYRQMATDNFTSITPNQSFKWKFLQPQQDRFDFAASDRIVNFAAQNGLRVRGCCLAWGVNNPEWLTRGRWTKQQAKDLLRTYITTVVGRYKGKVAQWDVVNEGLNSPNAPQPPYSLSYRSFWGTTIGPDYVALAFTWARAADPDAQLFYNDLGAEAPSPKFDAEMTMVRALKARGVPIDGVGLQLHRPVPRTPPYYPTEKQVATVLQAFAAIGVRTELTELDQPLALPASRGALAVQAMLFQQMMTACLSVSRCTGVTVWGVDDNDRYQQLRARNLGAATLFGSKGQIKPAFRAVVRALQTAPGPTAAERASPGSPA